MKNNLVSLSGFKGSGKDTVADYLVEHYGFTRLSFADYLKDSCAREFKIPRHFFDDVTIKEKALITHPVPEGTVTCAEEFLADIGGKKFWTPRAILIEDGGSKRKVDPNFFITKAIDTLDSSKHYVLTDTRFLNEANYLKTQVHTHRPVFARVNRPSTVSTIEHATESEMTDFQYDYLLKNETDITCLYEKVDEFAFHLGVKRYEARSQITFEHSQATNKSK